MAGQIIIIGRLGQVADATSAIAASTGHTVRHLARPEIDLAQPGLIARALDPVLQAAPPGSVLVNAAAYTDVNGAESEPELAQAINAVTPGIIAERCGQANIPLIHLSTDYVYDGRKGTPYLETDTVGPLGVYGRSKLAGDEAVQSSGARHVIMRTSAVFSGSGQNFLRTMLRLGSRQDQVRVVHDQRTCPTAAADIAAAIIAIAGQLTDDQSKTGIFNFCGDTPRSWAEFAADIFHTATRFGETPVRVEQISSAQFPSSASRPAYSVLDCGAIFRTFGISQPDYLKALNQNVAHALAAPGPEPR
ncbi:dTDP-4-dehydrorhamnose reductase [Maricaulis salignorans]|uniref:dTDP-4-dehydrorhamnose reductase n=1 Tax=Maricaulis salignorans TaxID=144026 RepID=A0A1G9QP68_9PROT|nr:dTDP-4-dehydrorhamnose reductase [Maricaulis salignorans]SDM12377.1 dTDP-4-dehydrorhamnose reductase [Maricaulis salignorans]